MFQVETEIAQRGAASLAATLTGSETRALQSRPTANVDAYQAYLKGRFFWNKRTPEGYRLALEHFNQAIAFDPAYAQAYAGLADAYLFLVSDSVSGQQELLDKGRAALRRGPAFARHQHRRGQGLPLYCRYDDAIAQFKKAQEMDPGFDVAHGLLGLTYSLKSEHEASVAEFHRMKDSHKTRSSCAGSGMFTEQRVEKMRPGRSSSSSGSSRTARMFHRSVSLSSTRAWARRRKRSDGWRKSSRNALLGERLQSKGARISTASGPIRVTLRSSSAQILRRRRRSGGRVHQWVRDRCPRTLPARRRRYIPHAALKSENLVIFECAQPFTPAVPHESISDTKVQQRRAGEFFPPEPVQP